jgi:hypothetical protein
MQAASAQMLYVLRIIFANLPNPKNATDFTDFHGEKNIYKSVKSVESVALLFVFELFLDLSHFAFSQFFRYENLAALRACAHFMGNGMSEVRKDRLC